MMHCSFHCSDGLTITPYVAKGDYSWIVMSKEGSTSDITIFFNDTTQIDILLQALTELKEKQDKFQGALDTVQEL